MSITPWGGLVFYREQTTSTMDQAQALEDAGQSEGSVVWAGSQTQGRGRHPGRAWYGEPGASLLFTAWWSPTRFRVAEFAPSLTVGLGVCLWLQSLGLRSSFPVALKWPNDVYLGDGKLAGILVRRRIGASGAGSIHAGIGMNLAPIDGEFRTAAVSLAEAGVNLTPARALPALLPFLAQALDHPDPRTACEGFLWRRGQSVDLTLPGSDMARKGIAQGLDPQGRLLWEGPKGLETLSSGE